LRIGLAFVALPVAGLLLAGCSSPAAPSHATSKPPTSQQPKLNAHDAIATKLGEPVVITYPGTTKAAVTITIDKIQTNLQCTEQFAIPAQHGQYLGLVMTVVTDADYEKLTGGGSMRIYGNDFSTATSAGGPLTSVNGSGGCVADEFPLDVPAGATIRGVDVLDVPAGVTRLVWNQSTFAAEVAAREWSIG